MAPSAVQTQATSSTTPPKPACQIITPVGMMGYGFNEEWTEAALARFSHFPTPTALILDSGSTDSGPSKLALGTTSCPRASYERDFRKLIKLSLKYKAPILMSSAGGDGSDDHVDLFLDIIRDIVNEEVNHSSSLKCVAVYSQIDKSLVLDRLEAGEISGCGPAVPELTIDTVNRTPRIVGQMGPEPFLDAMNANPDYHVMIGGRAYDAAPYVAFAAYQLLPPQKRDLVELSSQALGCITHMGKILECGGLCATPKGLGALGIINTDLSMEIEPLDPAARCIPLSVAAHTLYEKSRPDILLGPGGDLDVSTANYAQLSDGRATRVQGSLFTFSRDQDQPYTVKLEGARVIGFRTLVMGSFGDPILIPQMKAFLERAKAYAQKQHEHIKEPWDIGFHVYGFDEKRPEVVPNRVFVVAEAVAGSQDVATSIASTVRVQLVHGSYDGQKATSGNFGMGIGGKLEIETSECTEFSVYHLMPLAPGEERAVEVDCQNSKALFHWRAAVLGHGTLPNYLSGSQPVEQIISQTKAHNPTAKTSANPTCQPRTLFDIAKIIRSKNAGPFEVTLDVMFDKPAVYEAVKRSDSLSRQVIARLYNIEEDEVVWAGYFDVAMAFKATVPRRRNGMPSCSGGFMEDDVHGSQMYTPLMDIVLSDDLISELELLSSKTS